MYAWGKHLVLLQSDDGANAAEDADLALHVYEVVVESLADLHLPRILSLKLLCLCATRACLNTVPGRRANISVSSIIR